jgi:type I restriction enzyme R subunit
MAGFNEENAVEWPTIDSIAALGWTYKPGSSLNRSTNDVLNEQDLKAALIRLNPSITSDPAKADEVIYKLRSLLIGVSSAGLVRANEQFAKWVRGEVTMPFGPEGRHETVVLVDFDNVGRNDFVVANQVTVTAGPERRLDIVCYVNGIPFVVGEAKSPVRPAVTWVDGAIQVNSDYEANIPSFFVPNVFSFATEGREYMYGTVQMPVKQWGPWRTDEPVVPSLRAVLDSVKSMLTPAVLLDLARNFTAYATDRRQRMLKLICRYQQFEAVNRIVDRVVEGRVKKGLIWHFQGSGKSLLMVFAANKLRMNPDLANPTVMIVVDRIDLDTQITATFNATQVENTVSAETRRELMNLLERDTRKVIITTIHRFGEADGVLNDRSNIIVLVDEAHRTQEGDLGRKMRDALPNAFLFGLTGTPINSRDRNTFYAFGSDEDEGGYLSRYSFEDSIRDGATLPIHFEARSVELRIDRSELDREFEDLVRDLSEADRAEVSRRAGKFALLVKSPARVRAVVRDIARHYREKVEPSGFGAQIVTIDQEACVLYKQALDEVLPSEVSAVVISLGQGVPQAWRDAHGRTPDEEKRLLDNFRDPAHPLKILIVTARLLTGFDAPNLQCMYLDKPLREHTLLQAICRTNRPAEGKSHGLVVDYLGIFDDVAQALAFDEKSVEKVIGNLDELKEKLAPAMADALKMFPGVDRTDFGWEGLLAAQQCLPDNDRRDNFGRLMHELMQIWEALSPDPMLTPFEADYRWLCQVYDSLRPVSGNGKLLWHTFGPKTIELIHRHVAVRAVNDDLETLVLDAEVMDELVKDPEKNKVEIEIRISARLRKHKNEPKFVELSERLERLRERHEQGLLASVEFLKSLLDLARDVVEAEKDAPVEDQADQGKSALTELFSEVKNSETPIIVERVVADIDEIVRSVRFDDWQQTEAGEREVQRALRRTLLKYKLHGDQNLFERAYDYIRKYY